MGRTTDVLLGSPCRCGPPRLLLIDEERDRVVFVCVECPQTTTDPETWPGSDEAEPIWKLGRHRVATEEDLRVRGVTEWIVGRTTAPHGREIPGVGDPRSPDGCEDAPWIVPTLMRPWLRCAVAAQEYREVVHHAETCIRFASAWGKPLRSVYPLLAIAFDACGHATRAASLRERAEFYDGAAGLDGPQGEPRRDAEAARVVEHCERVLPLWLEPVDQLELLWTLESAERDRHRWDEWELQRRTHVRLRVPHQDHHFPGAYDGPVFRERLAFLRENEPRHRPSVQHDTLVFLDRESGAPLRTYPQNAFFPHLCYPLNGPPMSGHGDWVAAWDMAPRGWVVPAEAQLRDLDLVDRVELVDVASRMPWHSRSLALVWLLGEAEDERPHPAIEYETLLLLHAWHGRPRALAYEAFAKLHRLVGNDARAAECLVRAAFHHDVHAALEAKPFDADGLRRIEDRAETLLPEWPDEFGQIDLRRVIAWCRADRVRARADALREEVFGPDEE